MPDLCTGCYIITARVSWWHSVNNTDRAATVYIPKDRKFYEVLCDINQGREY